MVVRFPCADLNFRGGGNSVTELGGADFPVGEHSPGKL